MLSHAQGALKLEKNSHFNRHHFTMSKPIQASDIIFPELATNFSSTLASLKRSTLSISNRLSSISDDAGFVCQVADAYGLPLVANERCGSWYIPLERKKASAYFKSTDGHNGEWSMSLRRLNTQIIELINQENGCIIVDSTRRGKSERTFANHSLD